MYFRPMRKSLLILALLFMASLAQAQGYRGRDFWVAFPQNAILEANKTISMSLFICAESRTVGDVTNGMDSAHIHFNVEAGAYIEVPIDTALEILSSGELEKKSVHVVSDHDISLYVVSHRPASTDSYMAIPTSQLGTEYAIAGYSDLRNGTQVFATQCELIATESNTLVTATVSAITRDGQPRGRTVSVPMNRGEVFQLQGSGNYGGDLTGTTVTSTKPIAFFTGHSCAQVPAAISFCDFLIESEPPISSWGKDFILPKFFSKYYFVARVIAREDSTYIKGDSAPFAWLNRGEYIEFPRLDEDYALHSSKPILITQYATGSDADSIKVGDPFMLLTVPNDRFVSEVTTVSVVAGSFNHYVNVVVPDTGVGSLEVDDALVSFKKFPSLVTLERENHMPTVKATIYTFRVPAGRHTFRSKAPIAVYSYGFGVLQENYDSYGHTCGMQLKTTQ
jgi:hypothetical protein